MLPINHSIQNSDDNADDAVSPEGGEPTQSLDGLAWDDENATWPRDPE